MGELYDADVFEWSKHQAELLRRHAAGEKLNDRPDWDNIIEEIESVGRSEVRAIESWLFQAFVHDLKAEAWPLSREVPHWRAEARGFRAQARRNYRPSMRQHIDVPGLYRDALGAIPESVDEQPPLPLPEACPASLEELLAEEV
jgi:uncharacterized protein DUF29